MVESIRSNSEHEVGRRDLMLKAATGAISAAAKKARVFPAGDLRRDFSDLEAFRCEKPVF